MKVSETKNYLTHRQKQIVDICDSSFYLEASDEMFVLDSFALQSASLYINSIHVIGKPPLLPITSHF